jgi:2-polyprenyl-6-methoxyphenol hydroxylase-like FAD-dependent oxidoreductase
VKTTNRDPETDPHVVIVGAGIVGLLTALQLEKRGLRVLVIDRLPKRKYYKVGESLLIFSNAFMRTVGGIGDFCDNCHPKLGVWFTYDMEHKQTFDERPEWAFIASNPPKRWLDAMVSREFYAAMGLDVQISRPETEEALMEQARLRGIQLVTNGLVRDIVISKDGGAHTVRWEEEGHEGLREISCKWVIDCAGRKRILARQMGHMAEDREFDDGFRTSAVWGHFKNVTEDLFKDWKLRFPDGTVQDRDKFTLHLWGEGYWIWVIRLNEDRLSLGVCFDQNAPIAGKTYQEKFWDVIRRYPILKDIAVESNMIQFSSYKDMQYISDTYVHENRYAIVGDAATSIDAFYSQGMSISLVISWHITNVIERDVLENVMDSRYVKRINEHALNDWHMMRSTLKQKYSTAIHDSRFFILSHMMDLLMLSAGTVPRHLLIRWFLETDAGKNDNTKATRKMRERLSKKLFYSACYPYLGMFGPKVVSKTLYAIQESLAERARWRLEHGVRVPKYRFILRFLSKTPRVDKLFGKGGPDDFFDVSPALMDMIEPSFIRVTGRETTPISMMLGVGVYLPMMCLFGYLYDWADTSLLKMKLGGRQEGEPASRVNGARVDLGGAGRDGMQPSA